MTQRAAKTSQVENFARSATAPAMRAIAIIAKVAPKPIEMSVSGSPATAPERPIWLSGLPTMPPIDSPELSPYP